MKSKQINKVPDPYIEKRSAKYQQNISSVQATKIPQENWVAGKSNVSNDNESTFLNTDNNLLCSTPNKMNSFEHTQDVYLQEQAYDVESIKAEIMKAIKMLENQRFPCHQDVSINTFMNYETLETKPVEERKTRYEIMNKDMEESIDVFKQESVSSTRRGLTTSKERHECKFSTHHKNIPCKLLNSSNFLSGEENVLDAKMFLEYKTYPQHCSLFKTRSKVNHHLFNIKRYSCDRVTANDDIKQINNTIICNHQNSPNKSCFMLYNQNLSLRFRDDYEVPEKENCCKYEPYESFNVLSYTPKLNTIIKEIKTTQKHDRHLGITKRCLNKYKENRKRYKNNRCYFEEIVEILRVFKYNVNEDFSDKNNYSKNTPGKQIDIKCLNKDSFLYGTYGITHCFDTNLNNPDIHHNYDKQYSISPPKYNKASNIVHLPRPFNYQEQSPRFSDIRSFQKNVSLKKANVPTFYITTDKSRKNKTEMNSPHNKRKCYISGILQKNKSPNLLKSSEGNAVDYNKNATSSTQKSSLAPLQSDDSSFYNINKDNQKSCSKTVIKNCKSHRNNDYIWNLKMKIPHMYSDNAFPEGCAGGQRERGIHNRIINHDELTFAQTDNKFMHFTPESKIPDLPFKSFDQCSKETTLENNCRAPRLPSDKKSRMNVDDGVSCCSHNVATAATNTNPDILAASKIHQLIFASSSMKQEVRNNRAVDYSDSFKDNNNISERFPTVTKNDHNIKRSQSSLTNLVTNWFKGHVRGFPRQCPTKLNKFTQYSINDRRKLITLSCRPCCGFRNKDSKQIASFAKSQTPIYTKHTNVGKESNESIIQNIEEFENTGINNVKGDFVISQYSNISNNNVEKDRIDNSYKNVCCSEEDNLFKVCDDHIYDNTLEYISHNIFNHPHGPTLYYPKIPTVKTNEAGINTILSGNMKLDVTKRKTQLNNVGCSTSDLFRFCHIYPKVSEIYRDSIKQNIYENVDFISKYEMDVGFIAKPICYKCSKTRKCRTKSKYVDCCIKPSTSSKYCYTNDEVCTQCSNFKRLIEHKHVGCCTQTVFHKNSYENNNLHCKDEHFSNTIFRKRLYDNETKKANSNKSSKKVNRDYVYYDRIKNNKETKTTSDTTVKTKKNLINDERITPNNYRNVGISVNQTVISNEYDTKHYGSIEKYFGNTVNLENCDGVKLVDFLKKTVEKCAKSVGIPKKSITNSKVSDESKIERNILCPLGKELLEMRLNMISEASLSSTLTEESGPLTLGTQIKIEEKKIQENIQTQSKSVDATRISANNLLCKRSKQIEAQSDEERKMANVLVGCQVNNWNGPWNKNECIQSKNKINHQKTYSKENVDTQENCRDNITEPNLKHTFFKVISKLITEPMLKQKPTIATCSCLTWRNTLQCVDNTCQCAMDQPKSRTIFEKNSCSCRCPLKSSASVNALCRCSVACSTKCTTFAQTADKSTGVKTRPKNKILHKIKKKCFIDSGTKISAQNIIEKHHFAYQKESGVQCIQHKNNICKYTEVPAKSNKSTEMAKNETKFVVNKGTTISKPSVINVTTQKFESPKLVSSEENQLRDVITQTNENKSYNKKVQVGMPETKQEARGEDHVPVTQLKPTLKNKARAKLKYQNLPKNKCQYYPKCLELRKSKSSFYWKLSGCPKHIDYGSKKKNVSGAFSKIHQIASTMYCGEHVESKQSQKKIRPIRQKCLNFNFNQGDKYKKVSWKKYFKSLLYTPEEIPTHITRKFHNNETISEILNLLPDHNTQCNITTPYKTCNNLRQDVLQYDAFRHYHATKLGISSRIDLPQKISNTKFSQCLKSEHVQNNAMSQHNSRKRAKTDKRVKKDVPKVKSYTTTRMSTESKNSDQYIINSLRTIKTTENIRSHRNTKRENEACNKIPCLKFFKDGEKYCETLGNVDPKIRMSAKQNLSPVIGDKKMFFPTYCDAGDCYSLKDIDSNQAKCEKARKFQIVRSSSRNQVLPRMSKTLENINYEKSSSLSSTSRMSNSYRQNKMVNLQDFTKTQAHDISENYTSGKESFRSKLEKYFSSWKFFSKSIQTSSPTRASGKKFEIKENKRVNLSKSSRKETHQDNKTEEFLKRVNKYGNRKQHNGLMFNYRKFGNIKTTFSINNDIGWDSSKRFANPDKETISNVKERSPVTILFSKGEKDFDQFDSGPSDFSIKQPIDTSYETILEDNTYQSCAPLNSKCSKSNLQIWPSKSNNITCTQIPQKSAYFEQYPFDATDDFNSYHKRKCKSSHSHDKQRQSSTLDYISYKNETKLNKDLKYINHNASKLEEDPKSTEITKNRKTSWIFNSGETFKRFIQRCKSKQKMTIPLNNSQDVKISIHPRKKGKNIRECGMSRHEIDEKKQSDFKMGRKSSSHLKLFFENNQNLNATSKSCSNYMDETKNKRLQKSFTCQSTKPEYLWKSQEYSKRILRNHTRRDKTLSQCNILTKCKRIQVPYTNEVRTKDDKMYNDHYKINNRNHSGNTKQAHLQSQKIQILKYSELNKVNCSSSEKQNNKTKLHEKHTIAPSLKNEFEKQTSDKTIHHRHVDGKNYNLKQPEIRFIKKKLQPNCVTFQKKRKHCSKIQLTSNNNEFYVPCRMNQRSCRSFKNRPRLVDDSIKENCKHVKPCKICKNKTKSNCKQALKICSYVEPCENCKNTIELEYNNIFKSCSTEDIILKYKATPKICTHSKPCKSCKRKMEFKRMKGCVTCANKGLNCKSCRKVQSSECKQVLSEIEQCVNGNRHIFPECRPAPIVCTNVCPCILSNRNSLITPKLSYSCQRKNNKAPNKHISSRKLFDPCVRDKDPKRSCKACKPKRTCKQSNSCKPCKKRFCKPDKSFKLNNTQNTCKCRYNSCQPSGCCELHKLICDPYPYQSVNWCNAFRFCFYGLTFLLWMPFFVCLEIMRHMFCSCMK